MQSSFKLALTIGASISQSFGSAIKGSQGRLSELGASLNKLKNQQTAIKKVELAEANVGKARIAYNHASKEVMRLRKEISQSTQPSQKLSQAFEAAKQKTINLSNKLAAQKERLQRARRELEQAGNAGNKFARDQVKLGASIEALSQKYKKLSQAIQAGEAIKAKRATLRGQLFDALALGTALAAPVKVAVGFENSIAKLGSITRASTDELKLLEKTARSLGESTQFSASEAASSMTFLGMAGFKTNEIIKATPGLLSLAQAAGSDLAQSADIASNILSGFSLEAEKMSHVGDVLAATFTSSNTTLQMLGDTLKYAAPVASSVGASIEEVAAMAGLLGNVGIQGSQAGTALRAAFLRLSSPPKAVSDALENLGIEVSDLEGNLRALPELLKELSEATKDLGSSERASLIQEIFGTQASAGLTELIKQAGTGSLDNYIAQLNKAQGMADAMAKQMNATTFGALKRLGSSLESVAISFGSVLLPTVARGAEVFASFTSRVSNASQAYPFLTKVIVGATAGLMAFKVVSIATAYAYTFIKGGILSLITAYRALSAGLALARMGMIRLNIVSALSAIRMGLVTAAQWALNIAMNANPIGLIVGGIALLASSAYFLSKAWVPMGEFFRSLWNSIKEITRGSVDWILGKIQLLSKPFELINKVRNKVLKWFGNNTQNQEQLADNYSNHKLSTTSLGQTIMPESVKTTIAPPLNSVSQNDITNQSRTITQNIKIDAPITINALPNMDEKSIATEVQNALARQQAQMQVYRRAALYDEVS